MLVLSRKLGERIVIPDCDVVITVVAIEGQTVRLGIAAPAEIAVYREELWRRVRQEERAFLARARRRGNRVAVLDIPLLLETGGDARVDRVIVVSAPRSVQMRRIRARQRMSDTDIAAVIARQMPDAEKRRRADVVIRTGLSRHTSLKALRRVIREVLA